VPTQMKYINSVIGLVESMNGRKPPTRYGHQLTPDGLARKSNFLVDDAECDCSKLVLKAMIIAEDPGQLDRPYTTLQVGAFGGAKLEDLTAVSGMLGCVDALSRGGKAPAPRQEWPLPGDLMFWTRHVAMVTDVAMKDGKVSVTFATMGNSGAHIPRDVPVAKAIDTTGPQPYGAGAWKGFWTPTY
jgi:hypothetical protein